MSQPATCLTVLTMFPLCDRSGKQEALPISCVPNLNWLQQFVSIIFLLILRPISSSCYTSILYEWHPLSWHPLSTHTGNQTTRKNLLSLGHRRALVSFLDLISHLRSRVLLSLCRVSTSSSATIFLLILRPISSSCYTSS